jgi:hypothetical protein
MPTLSEGAVRKLDGINPPGPATLDGIGRSADRQTKSRQEENRNEEAKDGSTHEKRGK